MEKRSLIFLKTAVFAMGIVKLILCSFALPSLARNAANMNPAYAYLQYPVLIGLYLTAIPFFYALYQALKLLKYIEINKVFSELAVNALGIVKQCATAIITLYIIGMILLGTLNALQSGIAISGLIILFATFVIMFFAAVLQAVLKNALHIKLENDLTV